MRALIALLAICLLLPACSDDGPSSPPTRAEVTVTVVDGSGDPVPNLELNILNDNDFMQDGKGLKAATEVRYQVPISCRVRVTIADVAGRVVATLIDSTSVAGVHGVVWNGQDSDGVPMPSGRYETRMVCSDEDGTLLFGDAQPMLMCILDMDRMIVGTTDADGRIVLTDRTLFPHLYDDLPDMMAYDESANEMGLIELTEDMRFYLRRAGDGSYGRRYDVKVESSREAITLTWIEPSGAASADPVERRPPELRRPVEPGDSVFYLWPNFPNPFN